MSGVVDSGARNARRFIKRIDSRYCLPADIDVIRVLASWKVANEDGGTGWHYEYDVLYEEPVSAPDPTDTIRRNRVTLISELNWCAGAGKACAANATAALEWLDVLLVERQQAEAALRVAEERNAHLTEALAFYADPATYEESSEPHPARFATGIVAIEEDGGDRARAVLADKENAGPHD